MAFQPFRGSVRIDLEALRMAAALRMDHVEGGSCLMRFRIERATGAPKKFSVTVRSTPRTRVSDPDGCQGFPPIVVPGFDFEQC